MRFQQHASACGPAALHNALQALGIPSTMEDLEKRCGTTVDGTSVLQLRKGAGQIPGIAPAPLRETREAVAILRLVAALQKGHPVLMIVDADEHWVAAVGLCGERVLVADSADNALVLSYTLEDLAARWHSDTGKGAYFGIIL